MLLLLYTIAATADTDIAAATVPTITASTATNVSATNAYACDISINTFITNYYH